MPHTVVKGALLARLRPPFEPVGPYRKGVLRLGGIAILLAVVSISQGWIELASYLIIGILLLGGLVLLNRVAFLLTSVRVHEKGLEMDIVRSGNKSLFLPWDQLACYRIEGDTLHYTWRENGLMVLAGGKSPASWPYFYFPRKLRIPDERTMQLLRSLLP